MRGSLVEEVEIVPSASKPTVGTTSNLAAVSGPLPANPDTGKGLVNEHI